MKYLTPPKWAPNAIATDQGWRDPSTGELLVSYRGLKKMIENATEALDEPTPVEVTVNKIEEVAPARKSRTKKTS